MATDKQIAANRRNAQKSTGPRTEEGKHRSRQNAFRHGLTAQTVISLVERADEYADFETLIIADYEPQTTIERVLVERLASLLWRLRRVVTIETGLFELQAKTIRDRRAREQHKARTDELIVFRNLLNQAKPVSQTTPELLEPDTQSRTNEAAENSDQTTVPARALDISRSYLRLDTIDSGILERLERYEVSLWRQAAQTMAVLNSLQAGLKLYARASSRKYPVAWK
jgi:hypothetical protein